MAAGKCPSCGKTSFKAESFFPTVNGSSQYLVLVLCSSCNVVVGAANQDMNAKSIDVIVASVRELARKMGQKLSSDPSP